MCSRQRWPNYMHRRWQNVQPVDVWSGWVVLVSPVNSQLRNSIVIARLAPSTKEPATFSCKPLLSRCWPHTNESQVIDPPPFAAHANMQQQSRRPAPLALTNSDIVPLSRSRTASSAISQPAISVQQRPPNPPSPTQSTTSFTRRMSWLFTSPWSDSQSTTTLQSQSDNMLQAPLNHLRRGINPTTVSAPGRSAQIEQGRRRGSSISSACSVVSSVSLASTAVNGTVKPPTSSNSNSPQQIVSNSKNPEEYAIHVLFLEFAKASDSKLAWARNFKLVFLYFLFTLV